MCAGSVTPTFLPDARNPQAELMFDVQDGGFSVLLDGREVAWSDDANEAMVAFRAFRRAQSRTRP